MKYAFLRDELARAHDVRTCCAVLQVSPSGYYAWRARRPSRRQAWREALATRIRRVHLASRGRYGSPRVFHQLRAEAVAVSENTVAKVMRAEGLRARVKRRFVPRTTDSTHGRPVAPNVLGRQFQADRPNAKWAGDITYVPTEEGWLYLAGVMDLYSRRIVGWSMADHMETDLVADALGMALSHRQPKAGLVHHSDQGVQYASDRYQGLLAKREIQVSMSEKGDCWDNAAMESFWATLKTELIYQERYATRAQARQSIFEYIEVFYNRQRLHSSLGYVSPERFEADRN